MNTGWRNEWCTDNGGHKQPNDNLRTGSRGYVGFTSSLLICRGLLQPSIHWAHNECLVSWRFCTLAWKSATVNSPRLCSPAATLIKTVNHFRIFLGPVISKESIQFLRSDSLTNMYLILYTVFVLSRCCYMNKWTIDEYIWKYIERLLSKIHMFLSNNS